MPSHWVAFLEDVFYVLMGVLVVLFGGALLALVWKLVLSIP